METAVARDELSAERSDQRLFARCHAQRLVEISVLPDLWRRLELRGFAEACTVQMVAKRWRAIEAVAMALQRNGRLEHGELLRAAQPR
jgi:hypothetical protein